MSTTTRSNPLVPSRMALPPPLARGATRSGAAMLTRAFARYAVTLIAITLVFVVVALLDRAITPPGTNALPLPVIAVAGLGAAAVSTMLRRAGVRHQTPSPRRRAATSSRETTHGPSALAGPAAGRPHERIGGGAWRRPLLGPLAALGGASLMLALVVRSPHSVPLLVGLGLSGILALRLLAAPPRGIARSAAVASTPSLASDAPRVHAMHAAAARVDRSSRDAGWRDPRGDEVHDAALDSFPASDPPSWSPLRIGAPATSEPRDPAQA